MGDRISIAFEKDGEESIAFFSHWDGSGLLDDVKEYLTTLNPASDTMPLDRLLATRLETKVRAAEKKHRYSTDPPKGLRASAGVITADMTVNLGRGRRV